MPIAAYKKLYEIERELHDKSLDPDAVLAQRRERSKPIWDELVSWCTVHKKHEAPSSRLGIALRYFTNHRVALARFLDYGYVPMDNGIVERLHVRTAMTRKNYLFAGSDGGAERAAIAYTILGSCRQRAEREKPRGAGSLWRTRLELQRHPIQRRVDADRAGRDHREPTTLTHGDCNHRLPASRVPTNVR